MLSNFCAQSSKDIADQKGSLFHSIGRVRRNHLRLQTSLNQPLFATEYLQEIPTIHYWIVVGKSAEHYRYFLLKYKWRLRLEDFLIKSHDQRVF